MLLADPKMSDWRTGESYDVYIVAMSVFYHLRTGGKARNAVSPTERM